MMGLVLESDEMADNSDGYGIKVHFEWSFRSSSRTPLSMSVICWRSGVPIEGEQAST